MHNGEIRDPKKIFEATPAWGSETVRKLYKEYTAAYDIQKFSLDVRGNLAPIPVPFKVSRLDTYKYQ